MVNMTCPIIPDKPTDPKPLFENGQLHFKAHDVGWLVCGIMALIATISSFWLTWKHLTYYTCPQQQRHIVRLLVMVPIYAIVSFMSYLFYKEALYYQTIRDCYEAVLVTSFFYLLLSYTGDTRAEQHAVLRNIDVGDRFWIWPLGSWKYRPQGLHFLWLMKISVLQYAIVRPLCTFVAVGTQYFGYYCLHSWMPWFTHVWCAVFISVSVTVAMYCLIQLYMPVKKLVDPYKPILKFLSIKTIVFLTFWQDTFLSFLVSFNVIKDTEYFTGEQIQAGINALLQCFWMMLFGFIHIKAFSYLPYRPEDRSRTTLRGRAMLDAMDFRDWFFEMKESTRYMAARSKGRDYTLAEDLRAQRHQHLLNALGTQRSADLDAQIDIEKAALPSFWKHPQDAQFYSPAADESDSDYKPSLEAKHRSSDSYSPLPSPSSRVRKGGKHASGQHDQPSWRDSHTARAAELQRLVAELDLQDADASFNPAAGDETDYGFQDEKYERAALMQPAPKGSRRMSSPKEDDHPELTQYHVPTVQLANIPSLTFDQASSTGSARRGRDLSAVAEEDDESHMKQASKVAPGVGAFGIANWLGWSSGAHSNPPQQETNAFLSPTDGQTTRHQPNSSSGGEMDGTGWWRNYWNSVSNPASREPSILADNDESDPPVQSAVLRQVTAGSWGVVGGAEKPHQPALQIDTRTYTQAHPTRHAEASTDSSRISPHADSPLSRLIQTSRDSFSELKPHANASPTRMPPSRASGRPGDKVLPSSAASEAQKIAEEIMSSVDSKHSKHPIKFADALIITDPVEEEEVRVASPKSATKILAPAVGPKGKLVNLVLPSPLSPARYPYGQEGDAPPNPQPPPPFQSQTHTYPSVMGAEGRRGGGTIKFLPQSKPVKRETEPQPQPQPQPQAQAVTSCSTVSGKAIITVGNMSLAQARAEAERAPQPSSPLKSNKKERQNGRGAGKLDLPAPSKLATSEPEDPYRTSSNIAASSRQLSRGGTGSISTTFQVGSIVPRNAYAGRGPSYPHQPPPQQQHYQQQQQQWGNGQPRAGARPSQFHFEYYRGD